MMGVVSLLLAPLRGIFRLVNNHHDLPYATPGRLPPDPSLFPRYIQNKQCIWLHYVEHRPVNAPVGVVFLVMGLGEHSARYDSIALRLIEEGYYVFCMDNQGQGASEGERKYVERFSDYADDIQLFVRAMYAKHPTLASLPRFILGHSMGGLITVFVAGRDPTFWNGVVLSGPALKLRDGAPSFVRAIARFLSHFLPKMPVRSVSVDSISSNKVVVQLAEQDPAFPKTPLTLRFAVEFMDAVDLASQQIERSTYPFFIVHGTCDLLCDVEGSRLFLANSPSTDKQLKEYRGMHHEVLTETNREVVLDDVCDFLRRHRKKSELN